MTTIQNVKSALISFLEGDVTNLTLISSDAHSYTFSAIDTTRDNAQTKLIVELQEECYSVAMLINGSMQDIGMFEL